MPADAPKEPPRAGSSFDRPDGAPPVLRTGEGWAMEFKLAGKDSVVRHERVGGLVRVSGVAVIRHASGNVEQPVEIVMAEEDASTIGARILGELGRFRDPGDVG